MPVTPTLSDSPPNPDKPDITPTPPNPGKADTHTLLIAHKVINGHKGTNHPTPGTPDKTDTNHTVEHLFDDAGLSSCTLNYRPRAMTHPLPTHPPSL